MKQSIYGLLIESSDSIEVAIDHWLEHLLAILKGCSEGVFESSKYSFVDIQRIKIFINNFDSDSASLSLELAQLGNKNLAPKTIQSMVASRVATNVWKNKMDIYLTKTRSTDSSMLTTLLQLLESGELVMSDELKEMIRKLSFIEKVTLSYFWTTYGTEQDPML